MHYGPNIDQLNILTWLFHHAMASCILHDEMVKLVQSIFLSSKLFNCHPKDRHFVVHKGM